jgi:hypothetical protein
LSFIQVIFCPWAQLFQKIVGVIFVVPLLIKEEGQMRLMLGSIKLAEFINSPFSYLHLKRARKPVYRSSKLRMAFPADLLISFRE